MIIAVILASVVLAVCGQVSMKRSMNRMGRVSRANRHSLQWRRGLWPLAQGLSCYAFSMVLWLYTLSRVELSFAFPFVSLSYVGIALAARYGLAERFDRYRLAGSLVIVLGVILVGLSG